MALSRSARLGALATAAASFLVIAASSAPTPGADGIGDSYFPQLGNGGYDARHYDLDVAYNPDTDRLDGRTTLTARATQRLSSFDLDLQKLDVTKVEVNGRRAEFTREGDEIRVTPRGALPKGRTFTVTVTYGGVPQPLGGPIVFGSDYGWMKTADGVFVACEPNAASTWFPSSDHPADKATYDIRIKAPKGLTGISNGRLISTRDKGDTTVTHWRESKPMATYLATATIGKFDVKTGRTPAGTPVYVAIDPVLANSNTVDVYAVTAEATDYWSQIFGPYPFEETGAIVDDMPQAGFSLEVQSKPAYSAVRSESTIVHELAHQWFGDSVSVERWKDIWLNEGFATYAQWLWSEHKGIRSAHDSFRAGYDARPADAAFWQIKVADPQRDTMFASAVYQRGAMTLQMLRERIGDTAFFKLLPAWTKLHKHGNANTGDFIRLAERISGRQLDDLFQTWLFTTGKPTL
ncbi:metallopeptidase [Streptomyces avermitilis]|uniref:Aminopeptidase N n=3 Tax=Streptomyces avermitilis TaxID=33903 RepID=Q82JJ1_STRAW|nr:MULTISPECIES: M1 family metallopeptidase [Streptomyces]KUN51341.1 metallopeptidase [Streptomyces avermitilis]MYS98365.1 M1 family peptidase [Streptomyces sp. SID5469]OOV33235.1 metallopeptidase [Streptomyces avermitilis]BAC70475.1 putative metallopeptidase, secreted [Streptomyces avermitilis MA-4680 = NBRC 14893]GDY62600.1 peptidase [Streptomyces avermitilis]